MEADRTLGTSFWGQERISYELRRCAPGPRETALLSWISASTK